MKERLQTPSLNNDDIIRLLIRRQIELNSLLEITQGINNNFSATSLFSMYEFVLRVHLGIEKLCLFMFENNEWGKAASYGFDEQKLKNPALDIQAYLSTESYTEPHHFNEKELYLGEFDTITPVLHKSQPLAYVLTAGTEPDDETVEGNIKFIQTITNVIVVAIENKKLFKEQLQQEGLKREMELAQQVQTLLFPSSLPMNDKVQISADYLPHHSVGGDYYDYVQLNKNELIYCVADVAGKGISAALLMSNFQANLRTLALIHSDLKELVAALNKKVFENTKGDRFITLFIAKYNSATRQLDYINAGHNPPILLSKGDVSLLTDGTTILGIFDDLPFIKSGKLTLEPQTMIVTYTDGIVEMEDTEEGFDPEKLMQYVKENGNLPVKEFNEKLMGLMQQYKANNQLGDDVTLLSFRCF